MARKLNTPNVEWVDFKTARRLMQSLRGQLPSDDEAGRWLVERAISGRIRTDSADTFAELLAERRADDPELHHNWYVSRARWSVADIRAEAAGRETKRRGRPSAWNWASIVQEAVRKNPEAASWDLAALDALLEQIAEEQTGVRPGRRTATPYSTKIRAGK